MSKKSLPATSALESDFPAVELSSLAEVESWRKEVHSPATYTHKWWAKRLGTVFKGIIVSALSESKAEALEAYAQPLRMPGIVLFDPFAGSGTTLVESAKLGIKTIGRDINPVAVLVERQALAAWDRQKIVAAYDQIADQCEQVIENYYKDERGNTVLYYFWVALATCPDCGEEIELFSNRIFSRHAYPRKHPESKAVCASCGEIVAVNYRDEKFTCSNRHTSSVKGAVAGRNMTCTKGHRNKVLPSLKGAKPNYRMYAKLVVTPQGIKKYESTTAHDRRLYKKARAAYEKTRHELVIPSGNLEAGINTKQAMSWGFSSWDKFFNTRQLLTLGLLGKAIRDLKADEATREAMATLFSGTLEFNNLFCSFKGEGTGAVRHMFSNHILKPERVPLEANPWGTESSSGSFSTLFKSRLLRALAYKANPSDLILVGGEIKKTKGLSDTIGYEIAENWPSFMENKRSVYVTAADSARTDIPSESVDLVITDPPYMDNVHYSELADFFHAWLKHIQPYRHYGKADTTRSSQEVQHAGPDDFSQALEKIWEEAARVLKKNGIIAFTFHHARITGWIALVKAIKNAGLVITSVQPVKGEMSTSITKARAASPSNLDSIVVCRKQAFGTFPAPEVDLIQRLAKLQKAGIKVGPADISSVVRGSVLSAYTHPDCTYALTELAQISDMQVNKAIEHLEFARI